jgi:hypothetical protein
VNVNGNSNGKSIIKSDVPQFSRLFVLCPKNTSNIEIFNLFQRFGHIEDISIVKDLPGIEKELVYIKFSKASSAALALEEISGTYLNGNLKNPLKVFISNSRSETLTNQFENELHLQMQRLFIIFDKRFNKEDLSNAFKIYGQITNIHVVFDHATKESKGLGYISFAKSSEAALALEECCKSFKAKFAWVNTGPAVKQHEAVSDDDDCLSFKPSQIMLSMPEKVCIQIDNTKKLALPPSCAASKPPSSDRRVTIAPQVSTTTQLFNLLKQSRSEPANAKKMDSNSNSIVLVKTELTQKVLHSLLDLVPGLDTLTFHSDSQFLVKYESDLIAQHVAVKLNEVELPSDETISAEYFSDKDKLLKSLDDANKNVEDILRHLITLRSDNGQKAIDLPLITHFRAFLEQQGITSAGSGSGLVTSLGDLPKEDNSSTDDSNGLILLQQGKVEPDNQYGGGGCDGGDECHDQNNNNNINNHLLGHLENTVKSKGQIVLLLKGRITSSCLRVPLIYFSTFLLFNNGRITYIAII